MLIAGGVSFAYVFNKSGGSALVAVAAHMGAHLDNINRAPAAGQVATAVGMIALAIGIWARDRSIGAGT
jgi:hypothetical protein